MTYTGDGFSIQYPPDLITIQTETPMGFEVIPPPEQPWLRVAGKMFENCDLYLKFSKNHNAMIAVDITAAGSDGGYCWSYGYFKDDSKRTIIDLSPAQEITRSKWRNPFGDYNSEKVWQDNWQGDYFQFLSLTGDTRTVSFALLNQDGNREETEEIFDQIISTFTFLEATPPLSPSSPPSSPDEQVFCTMDAKVCPDGSSVGRVPPSCEFAACPSN